MLGPDPAPFHVWNTHWPTCHPLFPTPENPSNASIHILRSSCRRRLPWCWRCTSMPIPIVAQKWFIQTFRGVSNTLILEILVFFSPSLYFLTMWTWGHFGQIPEHPNALWVKNNAAEHKNRDGEGVFAVQWSPFWRCLHIHCGSTVHQGVAMSGRKCHIHCFALKISIEGESACECYELY